VEDNVEIENEQTLHNTNLILREEDEKQLHSTFKVFNPVDYMDNPVFKAYVPLLPSCTFILWYTNTSWSTYIYFRALNTGIRSSRGTSASPFIFTPLNAIDLLE
jgi:hypothetical protein